MPVSTSLSWSTMVVLCAEKCIFATKISAKKCSAVTKTPAKKCDYIYGKDCISKTCRMER